MTDRRRKREGLINVRSRSITARFAARAKTGGDCSLRKAFSASCTVFTILTPSPPEVPFAFNTVGNPTRATQPWRSLRFEMTAVCGIRMPSSFATSMKASRALTTGKLSAAPSERSISLQISLALLPVSACSAPHLYNSWRFSEVRDHPLR